jgi:hypothetical protein
MPMFAIPWRMQELPFGMTQGELEESQTTCEEPSVQHGRHMPFTQACWPRECFCSPKAARHDFGRLSNLSACAGVSSGQR